MGLRHATFTTYSITIASLHRSSERGDGDGAALASLGKLMATHRENCSELELFAGNLLPKRLLLPLTVTALLALVR